MIDRKERRKTMRCTSNLLIATVVIAGSLFVNAFPVPQTTAEQGQQPQQPSPDFSGALSDGNAALNMAKTATGNLPGGNAVNIAQDTLNHVTQNGGLKRRGLVDGIVDGGDEDEADEEEKDEEEKDEKEPKEKAHDEHDQSIYANPQKPSDGHV